MSFPLCSPAVFRSLIMVVVFCAAVGLGTSLLVRDHDVIRFFMAQPKLNGTIIGLAVLALAVCVWEVLRNLVQASRMDSLARTLTRGRNGSDLDPTDAVEKMGRGLVKRRCMRVLDVAGRSPGQVQASATALSDADAESEEERGALVRYIIVVLIFLGLIGTFWGLLLTVSGVKGVLASLDSATADDTAGFILKLKDSLDGLLGGMATAFSTSLFGLSCSVILGFVDLQTRKARSRLLGDLDRFVIAFLMPTDGVREDPVVQGIQVVLEHHAGRLARIFDRQVSADEQVVRLLEELKSHMEAVHEKQAELITDAGGTINRGLQEVSELVRAQSATGEALPEIKGVLEKIDSGATLARRDDRKLQEHILHTVQELVKLEALAAESVPGTLHSVRGLLERSHESLTTHHQEHLDASEKTLEFFKELIRLQSGVNAVLPTAVKEIKAASDKAHESSLQTRREATVAAEHLRQNLQELVKLHTLTNSALPASLAALKETLEEAHEATLRTLHDSQELVRQQIALLTELGRLQTSANDALPAAVEEIRHMAESIHEREHMVGVQGIQTLQQIQEHLVDMIHLQDSANTTLPASLTEIRDHLEKALESGAQTRKEDQQTFTHVRASLKEFIRVQAAIHESVPAAAAQIREFLVKAHSEDAETQRKSNESTDQIQQQLEELVRLHAASNEQLPAAVAAIGRVAENLQERDSAARKETVQLASQIRDSLVNRLADLERRMERLANEMQHSRDSADDMSKALIERLGLTNKTLSIGFADLISTMDVHRGSPMRKKDLKTEN